MKPLFTTNFVQNVYEDFVDNQINKTSQALAYLGEQIMNDARSSGEYTDRTGNLRSSIGYFIINDGNVSSQKIQAAAKDDGGDGIKQAKAYANEIMNQFSKGLVLVVFAGMEYAASVESKGFDVLTGSVERAGNIGDKLKSLIG